MSGIENGKCCALRESTVKCRMRNSRLIQQKLFFLIVGLLRAFGYALHISVNIPNGIT